ncbi:putative receptor [Klebsiella pneumoniae]|nr:putative receptor [Klebsiella pneumoniae]
MPGGGCALPGLQPQITTGAGAAETAGAGGLNIAETFPEGRGSPHGCGLRAVFCMDAASARPEACRDKSKAPRSGDVAGRSPGVQGAAATGRPLCAPSAMTAITQTINRERNRPGSNIEAVALLSAARAGTFPVAPIFRRVAAGVLPGLPGPLTGSHLVGPVSAAPPGDAIRHGAALLPGGGCALPGLLVRLRLSVGPASNCAARRWHQARSCVYAGWRLRLTRPTTPNHRWRRGC